MPHDKYGTALAVGDEVMIRCRITGISPDAQIQNLDLRDTSGRLFTLTANQVEKIGMGTPTEHPTETVGR